MRGLIGILLALAACKGGSEGGRAGGGGAAAGGAASDAASAADASTAAMVDGAAATVDVATASDAAAVVDAGAGRAATPTPPGVARLVLVHDVPLLRSEEKALQRVASALARGKLKGTVVDAEDEEAALLLPAAGISAVPARSSGIGFTC